MRGFTEEEAEGGVKTKDFMAEVAHVVEGLDRLRGKCEGWVRDDAVDLLT